ncbi:hypothetical protein NDU88_003233 [Pleurodeles waltl]|uniref:Uncharacterized protein n=1 Tax=Pleurodeles waltl TaxID=8319 RepID=A0AAV7WU69_PLEWA|nr:hypothetical protein NDU88_003233 [Pleurodeles waltl]
MRNTPDSKTGLSPHEILMGRAMGLPTVLANALVNITDDMVLDYCKGLADVVRSVSQQVEATTLPPIHDPGHNLRAGDWVVVRKHGRKTNKEDLGPDLCSLKTVQSLLGETRVETSRRASQSLSQLKQQENIVRGEPSQQQMNLRDNRSNFQTRKELRWIKVKVIRLLLNWLQVHQEKALQRKKKGLSSILKTILTEGALRGDKWPKSQVEKRKEVVVESTIEEEVDAMRKEDLSEGELNGDLKLKRRS